MTAPGPLTGLLDTINTATHGKSRITVGDLLHAIGERSITPVILAIAVLLVSPLSGIPGLPTLSALVLVIVVAQWLAGGRHLWLPVALLRREIRSENLHRATRWLRRPSAWVERHTRPRLHPLTHGPARWLAQILCLFIPASWPLLEVVPMLTSTGALTMALLTFGLLTGDGLYVLLGYTMLCGLGALGFWIAA